MVEVKPDPKPARPEREPKTLQRKTPLKAKPHDRRRGARSGKLLVCARAGCEETFYAEPSKIGKSKHCSRVCSIADLAERSKVTRLGSGNPAYKNGRQSGNAAVSRVFNLRLKGDSACRNCGSRHLVQLHHAIPRGKGTAESKTNLLNGLPLCVSCHSGWHQGWLIICRKVFRLEEWSYLLTVRMAGRDTEGWLDVHYPIEPRVPTCSRGHLLDGPGAIASNGKGARMCRRCRMDRIHGVTA